MKIILLLLLFIISVTAKCPDSAGAALMDENRVSLVECDAETLRKYYNLNDCCIVNLAECNNIAAAFALRRNVLDPTTLCPRGWIRGAYKH